ncbi:hypothetical protein MRB53_037049 [Persea americana]|nr:hypothetical protein MRB53_037049 [Persea americana]
MSSTSIDRLSDDDEDESPVRSDVDDAQDSWLVDVPGSSAARNDAETQAADEPMTESSWKVQGDEKYDAVQQLRSFGSRKDDVYGVFVLRVDQDRSIDKKEAAFQEWKVGAPAAPSAA